ncbi:MAG: zinc-finger domain-containing protein [Pseudomonadota bacterium]
MHPRVFLTFEHSNRTTCPYCGAIYELVDKADTHAV